MFSLLAWHRRPWGSIGASFFLLFVLLDHFDPRDCCLLWCQTLRQVAQLNTGKITMFISCEFLPLCEGPCLFELRWHQQVKHGKPLIGTYPHIAIMMGKKTVIHQPIQAVDPALIGYRPRGLKPLGEFQQTLHFARGTIVLAKQLLQRDS